MAKSSEIDGHLAVLKLGQILGFDCTVNDAAKRVFLMVSGYANTKGTAFPSVSRIARDLCVTRPAVTKQIRILEEHGYLERKKDFKPSGGRKANILIFNISLAQQFYDQPAIFSKSNVTLIVTYLVTLLRYGGLEPLELLSLETFGGRTKKTVEEIIIEKNNKKKKEEAIRKARVDAGAWQVEKEREAKTGVGKEHKDRLGVLSLELKGYLGSGGLVNFDIQARKGLKGMAPLEAANKLIKLYELEVLKHDEKQSSQSGLSERTLGAFEATQHDKK